MSGVKGINSGKNSPRYKHGETKTRLFKIWSSMHERCEREKHLHYKSYGGRGISVCLEWHDYLPFAEWARNNGYSDELTLDRISTNGNNEPSNCRWITMREQQSNKRSNRILEYRGKKYTLTQLAEKSKIKKTTFRERLNRGMSVEDAVNKPIRKRSCGARMKGGE